METTSDNVKGEISIEGIDKMTLFPDVENTYLKVKSDEQFKNDEDGKGIC